MTALATQRQSTVEAWTPSELDLFLFGEGTHRRLWEVLGAHPVERGVRFAVWAPNARAVSVLSDANGWEPGRDRLRPCGSSGVWSGCVPGMELGELYKFAIETQTGEVLEKADPFARACELPPRTASRVVGAGDYTWSDRAWLEARAQRDPRREPLSVYEVHLGSWLRADDGRSLGYTEIAPKLAAHVQRLGFTHVELLPVAEHPFYGSWGYQVTGQFAPSSRYGDPNDFRYLVDVLHRHGIGVVVDWVPAHFPGDAHGLASFDGTSLYEHADPRRGQHPDWGTLIFNTGRHEVRNTLLASALYWLEEFHVDGLRVDAVASMLYRDYSRAEGEWIPNQHGGREDLENVAFLQDLNRWVADEHPGCFTVAEESTSWGGVTRPVEEGGLGFTFKWNMGWMHDSLVYFSRDPIHRRHHQGQLTFAQLYERSEAFVMPLSHDEVVHGKGSLLARMPGDRWQQLANLRLLLGYQWTRPGKKLLFMGSELGNPWEWDHEGQVPWHLAGNAEHAGMLQWVEALGEVYGRSPALWRRDHDEEGFAWIDCDDHDQSVVSYQRRDGEEFLVVALNLTPLPREGYRIGVPDAGRYRVVLDSDDPRYGGSGWGGLSELGSEGVPMHGHAHSLALRLPPLACLVLQREPLG